MYLDEAKPRDASERGPQFLHANGFNRWSDKPVQFAVCDNGVSATIGEHAKLDGVVIRRLNDFITKGILNLRPDNTSDNSGSSHSADDNSLLPVVEGYAFQTTAIISQHVQRVRTRVQKDVSRIEYTSFELTTTGSSLFRRNKCPPRSGMMMAIQLALRKHFGFCPGAYEPVSLGHFLKGRVDLNHVLAPEVAQFCNAAAEDKSSNLRYLFLEGAKAHTKNLMRASRGQGCDRHLCCMKWSINEGEEIPALFSSPLYPKTRNPLVMIDSLSTGVQECGATQPGPDSFWIHYEPEENR